MLIALAVVIAELLWLAWKVGWVAAAWAAGGLALVVAVGVLANRER